MKCWNCQSGLEEVLLCASCGMPQQVEVAHPFQVLSVPPKLGWDAAELQLRYENMIQRCHPDLFRAHKHEKVLSAARSAVQVLNDAYRMLRKPVGRFRYVLVASGKTPEITRAVPKGLQSSAQIIQRVIRAVEDAQKTSDHELWEAQQDHLASLQVQVEAAEKASDLILKGLTDEWDGAVDSAKGKWPRMPEDWFIQVSAWIGEREYLDTLLSRIQLGRQEPEIPVTN